MRWTILTLLLLTGLLGSHIACAQPAATSPYRNLIRDAGSAADFEDQSTLVVFDSTWVDVDTTGLSHKRSHVLTKVLAPDGIARLRAVRFDYDPASNRLDLLRAAIHHADGRVETIDLSAATDQPQPQHLIYWGARMRVLPIPPLEVGDALEFESMLVGFTIAYLASDGENEKYIPPMRGTYYDVILFGGAAGFLTFGGAPPTKFKAYTIVMPDSKVAQFSTYNGDVKSSLTFAPGKLVYSFWKADLPAYTEEPREPDMPDIVPKVVFTNVRDWAEKSRWFYKVNEDRDIFGADDAIRREVAKITRDCKSDTAKFYALLHWVAQGIRYSGVSMGEGEGYTLHPGTMTFRDRAGVCKDIAGMLVTMLRVAGFTTYPVMTCAGSRVEQIPADQFNHCVVAVKKPDGSFVMLDPTWSPFNTELWSRAESEQHIVIGSPEGEDLRQIEKFTSEDNDFLVSLQSKLDADGSLSGMLSLSGKSQGDARLRRPFSDAGPDRWEFFCREWLHKGDPAAQFTGVKFGDLWNFDKPFTVDISFRIPAYARTIGDRIDYVPFSVKLLAANGRQWNFLHDLTAKERKHPIFTYNPRHVTLRETLSLPPGFKPRELPPGRDLGDDLASLKGGWKQTGNSLLLEQIWKVRDRDMPADKYAGLKKVTDAIKDPKPVALVIERKGGKR
jgi:transglutaminase-like putative cysteine protease